MLNHNQNNTLNDQVFKEEDYCLRGATFDKAARFWFARTTELCRHAASCHQTSPLATVALGRLLSATSILGLMLKGSEESVTLRIAGNGPLGTLTAVANTLGQVRGYCQNNLNDSPAAEEGLNGVAAAVGNSGFLHLSRDLGLKSPYISSVPLVSGEIGADLAHYFNSSEQTPSAVALGVLLGQDTNIRAAGAFIIQIMPGADPALPLFLEEQIEAMPPLSKLIATGDSLEEICSYLFADLPLEILSKHPLSFNCNCNREKTAAVLSSLGQAELESICKENGNAEIVCRFCSKKYQFTSQEIAELIEKLNLSSPDL